MITRLFLFRIVQVASVLVAACTNAQLPFSLDTTFRTSMQQRYVTSILPLEDGNVLASGLMRFPGEMNDKRLVRLIPTGERDATFYNSGLAEGKIVPWEDRFYVGTSQTVRRVLQTGHQDPTFIEMNSGLYFESLQGGDYHVYPDGRVLISGAHDLADTVRGFVGLYNLIWFSNEGYLDTTRTHRMGNGDVFRFKELLDGKFICSGYCTQFDGKAVDWIFKVHADGSTDTTFRSHVYLGSAKAFIPLPDDRVYAAGRFWRTDATTETLWVVRFLPDGSLDPTFVSPQFDAGAIPGVDSNGPIISNIVPYRDGKFFAMGNFQFVNGQPRRGICVLDEDGTVTPDFDDCGVGVFLSPPFWSNAAIRDIQLSPDSAYWYIAGAYVGYNDDVVNDTLQRFVTRLYAGDITTGAAPLSLGEGLGVRVYPNPSSGTATVALDALPRNATLVVRDALGRQVQQHRLTDHHTTLSLPHSGVYMVEVWDAHRRLATQRLVVQ